MCGVCGCSEMHDHSHETHTHLIDVEQDILAENNQFAKANRRYFEAHQIKAVNVMSSPGSGKTTLLTKTLIDLRQALKMAVIVGDQQTDADAKALRTSGAEAIQINTGKVCHLDAHRLGHSLEELTLKNPDVLFIENIGNLVCPALFDLGETENVVILSVTEGDNKPLKYPDMFRRANLVILTKMDLLPYVDFDVTSCLEYLTRINPQAQVICLSAKTGEGLEDWYQWLQV